MSHNADALIIHCMDWRLHPMLANKLPEILGVKKFDLAGIAGVGKNLLEAGECKECLMKQIGLSIKLHNTPKIVLVHHSDCGAYGGSFEGEFQKHAEDMNTAAEIIKASHPNVEVVSVFATLKGEGDNWDIGFEILS